MKVYYHGRNPNHRLYVQPGVNHPEISDFMEYPDKNGVAKPKLFEVIFENYKADVPDSLGKYLISNKFASKSQIVTPAGAA